jgi:hypothetical protein
MKTKLLAIGLILLFNLALLPSSVLATNGNYSHSKPIKSEINYDKPDSGDNAHPSGKDRSVEKGRSLTQGKSSSDPDNNGKGPERNYGKSDKPGSIGGVDKADQDGNNGCGNDDDFEDDNEGWCGKKPKNTVEKPNNPDCKPSDKPKTDPKVVVPTTPVVAAPTAVPTPTVLGTVNKLPQTGSDSYLSLIGNLALAVAVILSGVLLNMVVKYRYSIIKK